VNNNSDNKKDNSARSCGAVQQTVAGAPGVSVQKGISFPSSKRRDTSALTPFLHQDKNADENTHQNHEYTAYNLNSAHYEIQSFLLRRAW